MVSKRYILLLCSILCGLFIALAAGFAFRLTGEAAVSSPADQAPNADRYVLLAWNDLGMHCYNRDFQNIGVLPPYNTLWAQVIRVGDPPEIITSNLQVTYVFTDNTESVSKSNFWTYAQSLFGLTNPLTPNIGLTGRGLSGTMTVHNDHFSAEGIPLTEFTDSNPGTAEPYQLATIIVSSTLSGERLAEAVVVSPVSTEMHCDTCHNDTGEATAGKITPTGKTETNILTLHDQENLEKYPANKSAPLMSSQPVLCASCHASAALGAPGEPGVPNLSKAMHTKHSEEDIPPTTAGCYSCHPGPNTRCLRDAMSQKGMGCVDCHGDLAVVAQNISPWLNEPRCDHCHGKLVRQDHALYRMSSSHGGVYCEGCHDSTHAIAPSSQPRDGLKFMALQGQPGPLRTCTVCHTTDPGVTFTHQPTLFLPLTTNKH
jgi:hypothetical protein